MGLRETFCSFFSLFTNQVKDPTRKKEEFEDKRERGSHKLSEKWDSEPTWRELALDRKRTK